LTKTRLTHIYKIWAWIFVEALTSIFSIAHGTCLLEIFKTCIHIGGQFDGYQNLILGINILCLESLLQEGAYNHNALKGEPCPLFFY
jgi:hypothetical protein